MRGSSERGQGIVNDRKTEMRRFFAPPSFLPAITTSMYPFIRHWPASSFAAACVLLIGTNLWGQEGRENDSLEIDALLLRLCSATAMEKQMENAVDFIVSGVVKRGLPPLDTAMMVRLLRCGHIVRAVAPVYRQRFTADELLEVVNLFECPEVVSRYRRLTEQEGESHALLGNDLKREDLIGMDSCGVAAGASGVEIWFDMRYELQVAVSREVVILLRNAVRAGLLDLNRNLREPDLPPLTGELIRADAAGIPAKKYADIVRCLKGAGFRDFLLMTWNQSLEDGGSGRFGEPMSADMLEWFTRLQKLMAARMDEDTLIAVVAPVFDAFFTPREMKLLADFYQTRAGKSYVRVKLRQYREPERLTEIFMEEFDKLPPKEQDRLIAFRDTEAADKFIMQSAAMSQALYDRHVPGALRPPVPIHGCASRRGVSGYD